MPRWRLPNLPNSDESSTHPLDGSLVALPADAGRLLLPLARAAIASRLGVRHTDLLARPGQVPAWLSAPGACFVTLETGGLLRGCIGSVAPRRSLLADVEDNARAAAFRDRRFPPLTREELDDLEIEVSVLSPESPMPVVNEADAAAQLRPGQDGVVFECGGRRSVLIPRVWDRLRDPQEFLLHLKVKAGFPADFWSDRVRLSRFTATEFREARDDS
jgi:AmmeMemoRadiSam system protein A